MKKINYILAFTLLFLSSFAIASDLSDIRAKAEAGNAMQQSLLGVMYYVGQGVERDHEKARHWFTKSAEQGYSDAQFNLGVMYGDSVDATEEDMKMAAHWFSKSAEQGDPNAQCRLGLMYDSGEGVPEDDEKAVYWFTKSAEQGDSIAQFRLGLMYDMGEGVEQDYVQAHKWWNIALANGVEKAKKTLTRVEKQMMQEQIVEAKTLARDWLAAHDS